MQRPAGKEKAGVPDLSVVVCSLGGGALERAVDSVRESAAAASVVVEIVVAWQGAGDPPALGDSVRALEVFPYNLSFARNLGLEAAEAGVVAFVDDDEVVDEGWARAAVDAFGTDNSLGGAFGPIDALAGGGIPYNRRERGAPRFFRGRRTPPWAVGSGGNMAFDRKTLLAAGGFDLLFGAGSIGLSAEESDLIVRLLSTGVTLAWVPEMLVYHPTKSEAERLSVRYPYGYGMGKVVRRHRDPALAARYLKASAQALTGSIRAHDARRRRESLATLHGFVDGAVRRANTASPMSALERIPAELRAELGGPLEPLPFVVRGRTPHLLYHAGTGRVLHLYVNPSAALVDSLDEREQIRLESRVGGIPHVYARAVTRGALWVVEELVSGRRPAAADAGTWLPRVAEWAVEMALPTAEQLGATGWWLQEEAALLAALPEWRTSLGPALEIARSLPATHLHGDLQRKNILLHGSSLGVLDWEGCSARGLPGLDLLFVAVMARGDVPDASVVDEIAAGGEPRVAPLRSALARVGVSDAVLLPTLLVILAVWAARERARLAEPGSRAVGRLYQGLLEAAAPRLLAA